MGYREYGRHRGVTLAAVQKAITSGRIRVTEVGGQPKIDSDQADRDWQSLTDPAKQSLLYSSNAVLNDGAAHGQQSVSPDVDLDEEPIDGHSAAYREHRADRERLRKEREQLELDQLRGRLIGLDDAKRLAFTAFRSLRDAVLNVPARVKDQCAAEADALRIEQLLDAELTQALQAFDVAKALQVEADDDDAD